MPSEACLMREEILNLLGEPGATAQDVAARLGAERIKARKGATSFQNPIVLYVKRHEEESGPFYVPVLSGLMTVVHNGRWYTVELQRPFFSSSTDSTPANSRSSKSSKTRGEVRPCDLVLIRLPPRRDDLTHAGIRVKGSVVVLRAAAPAPGTLFRGPSYARQPPSIRPSRVGHLHQRVAYMLWAAALHDVRPVEPPTTSTAV